MKQIIQSYRTGEVWLADVPAPALRNNGGAIVRTAASLVSAGTEKLIIELAKKSLLAKARARPDLVRRVIARIRSEGISATLEKVFAKLDSPVPLGYSCAGTILEAGAGLAGFKPGDRVACGGAGCATHAEVNHVPRNLLVRLPDSISFEDAAFTTLGAIAMQGVRQADVRLGERVVVIGLGLIGLLVVQILKAAGCSVLGTDPDQARCGIATSLGADQAVSHDLTEAAIAFSEGQGADAVIITAATPSNEPIETAAAISRMKGRVVVVGVVGMNIPRDSFYRKELDLRLSMSYGPGRYDPNYEEAGHDYPIGYVRWTEQRNMASFVALMSDGKVTPAKLITHRFDIDDALKAYELLGGGSEPYLGMVINYPHDENRPLSEERAVEIRQIDKSDRIGAAFVGAGSFAKGVLIPALAKMDRMELVAICTATGISAAETARRHNFGYATTDYQRLLDDPRINAIFIATRHNSHAKLACEALRAGKHVFVEKPLCMKPHEIDDYCDAIEISPGRCLMVGFNRRFSPHTAAIRTAFAARGTPMLITYRVNAGSIPKDSWVQNDDSGGGRIIGEVCHFVDWCEHVTGAAPVSVQAESIATSDARITADDSLVATIRYSDGSVATIQYVALGSRDLPKERIEVFADGTAAVLDDFTSTTFFGSDHPPLKTKQDKGFTAELAAFTESIRCGGEAPIGVASMLRTTRVTFAILESLRSGKPASLEPAELAEATI